MCRPRRTEHFKIAWTVKINKSVMIKTFFIFREKKFKNRKLGLDVFYA